MQGKYSVSHTQREECMKKQTEKKREEKHQENGRQQEIHARQESDEESLIFGLFFLNFLHSKISPYLGIRRLDSCRSGLDWEVDGKVFLRSTFFDSNDEPCSRRSYGREEKKHRTRKSPSLESLSQLLLYFLWRS